jgi:RNA polymerase primary sigma factor
MSKNLQDFFESVGKTDLLSRAEEVELSKKIEEGDQRARDRMIRANIRLAISIAKKYSNKGVDLEDLIQESSLGLIKAVDRFDWRKGFKFSTYACWWIKQAVRQHVAAQSGSIKLPSYARGTLWKMKELANEFQEEFGVEPTHQEIADLLGTSPETLRSLMKCAATPVQIDGSAYKTDSGSRSMHEVLVDDDAVSVEDQIDREQLIIAVKGVLSELTPREETVLRLRFGITEELDTKGENNVNAQGV